MFRPTGVGSNKWEVDVGFQSCGKFNFCFFRGFSNAVKRHFVVTNVHAGLLFGVGNYKIYQNFIHVFAAQGCVAAGGFNFKGGLVVYFAKITPCVIDTLVSKVLRCHAAAYGAMLGGDAQGAIEQRRVRQNMLLLTPG